MSVYFYGDPNDDRLEHTDPDDYIEYLLDALHPEVPEAVLVAKFRHVTPNIELLGEKTLEYLLLEIDERYGDQDGEGPEPTPEMEKLAKDFVKGVLAGFEPWALEIVSTETVRVDEWMERRNGIVDDGEMGV